MMLEKIFRENLAQTDSLCHLDMADVEKAY